MRKRSFIWITLLFALTAAFAFTACSKGAGSAAPSSESGGAWLASITDSYGEEVVIEKEPETVVSIAPNITEIIFALGAGEKLVARTDYCDYPAEVSVIQSIGSLWTPDIEKIVEIHPDLVITSTHFSRESAEKLRDMGITVLSFYEDEDFGGSYSLIEKVGMVLNREAEAASIVENMKLTVNEVTSRVSGLERPSVYYVVGFGESGDYTTGGNTFIGQMLEMAGGDNIAKTVDGWSFNLESLLEADPDIIIVPDYAKTSFEGEEGYQDLTAVREGRVYGVDNNMLDRQGVRSAEGLKTLAEILHPFE